MNKYGFIRIATAVPSVKVSDTEFNSNEIYNLIKKANDDNVYAVVFPELCITGYTCADLFPTNTLINSCNEGLKSILSKTRNMDIIAIIGMPVFDGIHMYNSAVVIQNGKVLGAVPKTFIPNYSEFYENRWFYSADKLTTDKVKIGDFEVPFGTDIIFKADDFNFAIEICEDMWVSCPPSARHTLNGAEVIFNCSASNAVIGKANYREMLVKSRSFSSHCIYAFTSCGPLESTTDTVFSGNAIIAENGAVLLNDSNMEFNSKIFCSDCDIEKIRFDRRKSTTFYSNETNKYRFINCFSNQRVIDEINRKIDMFPFVPNAGKNKEKRMEEIYLIQATSLAKRLKHIGSSVAVIGISGGLDSTLALLVVKKAMDILNADPKNIIAVTMPGFGTTDRTYNNAVSLIKKLGATFLEISIKDACIQHFKDINHDKEALDVTYENSQARERTQILMDLSNKYGGIVIGTGDLSELALGWDTYNGDHMSMYAVNCGVPKSLVKHLVSWISTTIDDDETVNILSDVLDTPISPELLPADKTGNIAQKTEEILGNYNIHDFILYNFLRYGFTPEKILYLLNIAFKDYYTNEQLEKCVKTFFRRFFINQFKRSCMPDGPKIGSITLSPRADWRMPSDASFNEWLKLN